MQFLGPRKFLRGPFLVPKKSLYLLRKNLLCPEQRKASFQKIKGKAFRFLIIRGNGGLLIWALEKLFLPNKGHNGPRRNTKNPQAEKSIPLAEYENMEDKQNDNESSESFREV